MSREHDEMKTAMLNAYDRLCMALTCYEACDKKTDPEYDAGAALYEDIVNVVQDLATFIN